MSNGLWRRALRFALRLLPESLVGFVWRNPLFDRDWYLSRYPDVARDGSDPARHYRRHGSREGRSPNALFNTSWYLDRYPDVRSAGIDPLDHYYLFGASEGREPGPSFDTAFYASQSSAVATGRVNPLLHYLRIGYRMGLRPSPATAVRPEPVADEEAAARRLVLVVHDALNHGAQQAALHIAETLNRHFGVRLDIVLLGEGELWAQFERWGTVHDFATDARDEDARRALLRALREQGADVAICNTTVSGRLIGLLAETGFRTVTLVHEMPWILGHYGLEDAARDVAARSDHVVFAADLVRSRFADMVGAIRGHVHIRPQGLYRTPHEEPFGHEIRASVREELALPHTAHLVLAAGWADHRKGFDRFVDAFLIARRANDQVAFVWLGCEDGRLIQSATTAALRNGHSDWLRLLPMRPDIERFYAAADLLLLPSREDPFPSVVLEAMAHGLPVVAFAGATGAADLITRAGGVVVPADDIEAMAAAVVAYIMDERKRREAGERGRQVVADEHGWLDYLHFLLELCGMLVPRVSVIVPNYNYAPYLDARLDSIFRQTHPVREVLVLDDASTDGSLGVIEAARRRSPWEMKIQANSRNSGSVFRQWLRAARAARGEVLWIAEADDFADPTFLDTVVPLLDGRTVLAYAESRQVDADGTVIAPDYRDYVADIDGRKWMKDWVADGREELANSFAIRNVVPNVSAAVFDRSRMLDVLERNIEWIGSFHVAGDYATYVTLLVAGGRVAFVATPLNNHRRHERGRTISSFGPTVVREIARVQEFVREHVTVEPTTQVAAERYLEQLAQQFDMDPRLLAEARAQAADARRDSARELPGLPG